LVGAIWLGAPWLTVLVIAAGLAAIRELYRITPIGVGPLPFVRFPVGLSYLVLGPVYVGFLLAHALMLREITGSDAAIGETDAASHLGRSWLLFALLTTFAVDTGAYLVGRTVGRRPMVPSISPNKTWEGSIGGFASAVGAALALGLVFDLGVPVWQQAVIGAVIGVVAQWGDLIESKLKRIADVKDAGSIIPGHGGILDRLDSILLTIPAVYYLLVTAFTP
jgi:phosphatidate cytidylyltransferase